MSPANTDHDRVEGIRRLYYAASRQTIGQDLVRAIDLFTSLQTEEARERAAVFMDGLSQMRSEWSAAPPAGTAPRATRARTTDEPPRRKRDS